MAEIKNILVKEILVNLNNPRYEQQADEEHEMAKILSDKNRSFELMKDIAKNGLDPSELIILVYDESLGKYIVMEGNRRITALKVLNDPKLVPFNLKNREKILKKVHSIIQENNYQPISKVQSVIYKSDDLLLNHFIELKHTGEKKGAGRVKWDSGSKARFDSADHFRKYLLSFIKSVQPGIQDNFGLTTIERIISDPEMRVAIGLLIDKNKPEIKFVDAFSKFKLQFILNGLITKNFKVRDFYNKSNREVFAKKYLINPLNQPWRRYINSNSSSTDIESGHTDSTDIQSGHTARSDIESGHTGSTDIESGHTARSDIESVHTGSTDIESGHTARSDIESVHPGSTDIESGHTARSDIKSGHTGSTDIESGHTARSDIESVHTGSTDIESGHTARSDIKSVHTDSTDIESGHRGSTDNNDLNNNRYRPRDPLTYGKLTKAYKLNYYFKANPRINKTKKEISEINYKEFTISSMFLIRSLLESYVNEYIDFFTNLPREHRYKMSHISNTREKRKGKEMQVLIHEHIKNHLKDTIKDYTETHELIDITFSKNNNTSVMKIINFHIHSGNHFPDKNEILEVWSKISTIINTLDKILGEHSNHD